jgi:hypothetical protein
MPENPSMEADAQHRARRHAAFTRAAEAHRRAADVEDRAILQFELLGDVDAVERHRTAARRQPELAQADAERADRWA